MRTYCIAQGPLLSSTVGFPGGSVVKNLPANAGEQLLFPILRAMKQLSPCAITIEPLL